MFRCAVAFCLLSVALFGQVTRNVPAQFPTIQGAIGASSNGDTVMVAAGTYNEALNFLGKSVSVIGAAGALTTIIQGTPGQRVVAFTNNEGPGSILNGFTVTGGAGGIQITRASPTIMNCTITGNAANQTGGGGVRIVSDVNGQNASPTFTNCRITNNLCLGQSTAAGHYEGGGGVSALSLNSGAVSLNFSSCVLSGNTAGGSGYGGALWVVVGTLTSVNVTMTQCLMENNVTDGGGGAAFINQGTSATFNRCTIRNNTAVASSGSGFYGGIATACSGTVTYVGCLFHGNTSSILASAIHASPVGSPQTGSLQIQNCTIVDNVSSGPGVLMGTPSAFVTSSIIRGNSGLDIGTQSGSTTVPSVIFSNVGGYYGSLNTNSSADPRFVDPALGDYHLSSTSPCVNTGSLGVVPLPATDLDGSPRLVGPVDMGADERPNPAFPGSGADLDLYAIVNSAGDPLASTVAAPIGSQLKVTLKSAGGTFVGAPVMIAGQLYATGSNLALNPAFPMIQINGFGTVLMYSSVGGAAFTQPGLPSTGITLAYIIPPGLSGSTLRTQGFAVTPIAGPLGFIATDARDVTL